MSTDTAPKTGTIAWIELNTTDVPAAKKFYTELFGWTTREMDMGPIGTYTIFQAGGADLGGFMTMPEEMRQQGAPPRWMNYMNVVDVDASAKKVEALGGKICAPPFDVPGVGRMAVISDPTGGTIAIYKPA
jgi:hypothetical protein